MLDFRGCICSGWIYLFLYCLNLLLVDEVVSETVQLRGAGASFPSVVYFKWLPAFKALRSHHVYLNMTYEAIGSGNGKKRIKGLTEPPVEYAGSDSELSEQDYVDYPDLQMFPTMAGAVVLAFNLPGIGSLNLTRDHVVGIYNGTFTRWDDASFQEANAAVTLPAAAIKVIARADKSGTTELFTSALSAFSGAWKEEYGAFSAGLDDDGEPEVWDPAAISYYGKTNQGVSGLILSIKYSIGYLAVADAKEFNIAYANLVNKAGHVVDASIASVQSAMDYYASAFSERMTASISDAGSDDAYPIAGYTYLIVHMQEMAPCSSAVELYRYVTWFNYDDNARMDCIESSMVPLSEKVSELVMGVMNRMTCDGLEVWSLVEAQIAEENTEEQVWEMPVTVASPFAAVFLIVLSSIAISKTWKLNKALLREEWKIPADQVEFERKALRGGSKMGDYGQSVSSMSLAGSTTDIKGSTEPLRTASWHGTKVCLRWLGLYRMTNLKRSTRRTLLKQKFTIDNTNVLKFYGICEVDKKPYLLSEFCQKGALRDVLLREKFRLDITFKFSLAMDVASGMEYLHKNEILHGNLSATSCLVDSRWGVKVADWEYYSLSLAQRDRTIETRADGEMLMVMNDENALLKSRLHHAPERILDVDKPASRAADSYSFAIVLYEIFALRPAYHQILAEQEAKEVVEFIISGDLRPDIPEDFLEEMVYLLDSLWASNPKARLGFGKIVKLLQQINPSTKSVMDCMMERLEEKSTEMNRSMKRCTELLHQMLPPMIATRLTKGEKVEPESFSAVTIYFSDIVGFTSLSCESSSHQIVDLLNDLYTVFDNIADRHDVYKVETIGDAYMIVSGAPQRNHDDHALHIANMSIEIATAVSAFKIRHCPERKLQLRIGVHSGPVVAGIVGSKMPRYCLFGDTVVTASRMESSSIPMKIQISEPTNILLEKIGGYVSVLRHQTTGSDGKSPMNTYWLHGHAGKLDEMPEEFRRNITAAENNAAIMKEKGKVKSN